MSSASWAGVLPAAGMSVISGVVMRPSGRTWTLAPSSALRQTKTVSSSSGADEYFSRRVVLPSPTKLGGGQRVAGAAAGGAAGERERADAERREQAQDLADTRMDRFLFTRSPPAPPVPERDTGAGFGSAMARRGKITVRNKAASSRVPDRDRRCVKRLIAAADRSFRGAGGWPRKACGLADRP